MNNRLQIREVNVITLTLDGNYRPYFACPHFQHHYKNIKLYINEFNEFNYFIQNPNKVINKLKKNLDISKSFEETLKDFMMKALEKAYNLFTGS